MSYESVIARSGVVAGGIRRGVISAGNLASGTPIEVSYTIVCGPVRGPVLYVEAACHGSEINGLEVIKRLVTEEIDPGAVAGAIIFVPVTNVMAFDHRALETPFESYDNRNMNRVWPGKADAGTTERLARAIWDGLIVDADYVIDLHTGNSTLVPHVVYMAGRPESRGLAEAFGLEFLVQEEVNPLWKEKSFANKLRNAADDAGKPAICPELGGNLRFEEHNIRKGVQGVLNAARHLGMLPGKPVLPSAYTVVQQAHLTAVRVSRGGALSLKIKPGERVSRGQVIAAVWSPRDFATLEEVLSPIDGVVLMLADNPIVHSGEFLAMMGRVLA
jgi:predicted deacylase